MGRAARQQSGLSTAERTSAPAMPSREAILLDIEDGALGYYQDGKLLYIDTDLEIYTDEEDMESLVEEYYSSITLDILERARRQLKENGEISVVYGQEISVEFDRRTGSVRTDYGWEETWKEEEISLESSMSINEKSEITEEDRGYMVERTLKKHISFDDSPEARAALAEAEKFNSEKLLAPHLSAEQIDTLTDEERDYMLIEADEGTLGERVAEAKGATNNWEELSPEVQNRSIKARSWRDEFTSSFAKHNGEESSPESSLEEAAPFYDMPLEKQLEWIRDVVDDGLENGDREIFGIGNSGAVYGEVRVVDEDGDGRPIRPEKYITVYREVWEPTGETGDDGAPRFERKDDEFLAEADWSTYVPKEGAQAIRQALIEEADWISIPEDK